MKFLLADLEASQGDLYMSKCTLWILLVCFLYRVLLRLTSTKSMLNLEWEWHIHYFTYSNYISFISKNLFELCRLVGIFAFVAWYFYFLNMSVYCLLWYAHVGAYWETRLFLSQHVGFPWFCYNCFQTILWCTYVLELLFIMWEQSYLLWVRKIMVHFIQSIFIEEIEVLLQPRV